MDVRFDSKLRWVDFNKVKGVRPGTDMQNVIIRMSNGHKIVVGINRKKNPHRLYVLTTDPNMQLNPVKQVKGGE